MENIQILKQLKDMLREQLYCLGRICARHAVPDDAVWDIVKGFDLVFTRIKNQLLDSGGEARPDQNASHVKPHPGIMHLLEKLEK